MRDVSSTDSNAPTIMIAEKSAAIIKGYRAAKTGGVAKAGGV
jgi:hypothetical protein